MAKKRKPKNDNLEIAPAFHALTVNELMARWNCDRRRVLEAIHDGRLTAFRVGKRIYRVTIAEVERFEMTRAA